MTTGITLKQLFQPLVVGLKRVIPTLSQAAKPYSPPTPQERLPINFEAKPQPGSGRLNRMFTACAYQPIIPNMPISLNLLTPIGSFQTQLAPNRPMHADEEDVFDLEIDEVIEDEIDDEIVEVEAIEISSLEADSDDDSAIEDSITPARHGDIEEPLAFQEDLEPEAIATDSAHLQAELEQAHRHIDEREVALCKVADENIALQGENQKLQTLATRQQAELEMLTERLKEAEDTINQQAKRASSAEEKAALADQLYVNLQEAKDTLSSKDEALALNQATLVAERSDAEKSIDALTQELEEKEDEISQLKQELQRALKQNQQLTADLDEMSADFEELALAEERSQIRIGKLSAALESATARLAGIRERFTKK